MKKLSILLIVSLFLTGCWEDVAGGLIIAGVKGLINNQSRKIKNENCKKYSSTYKWLNTFEGDIIDMKKKDETVYMLRRKRYKDYILSEINVKTGTVLRKKEFEYSDIYNENQIANSSIDDIIILKDDYGSFLVYDFKKHDVLWFKKSVSINDNIVNGYLYGNDYKYGNNGKDYYITKVNPVSGKTKQIFTFPKYFKGDSIYRVNNIQVYSDLLGDLYFSSVMVLKETSIVSVIDFTNNTTKEIYRNSGIYLRNKKNILIQDDTNLFLDIENDVYCFDKFSGTEQWVNYTETNSFSEPEVFSIEDKILKISKYKETRLINTFGGTTKFKTKTYSGNIIIYKDKYLVIDIRYLSLINGQNELISKYIAKSYCENNQGFNKKFIVNKSEDIILSDGNYIGSIKLE